VRDYPGVQAAVQSTRDQFGCDRHSWCGGAAGKLSGAGAGDVGDGFKAVIDIDLIGTFNTCPREVMTI